jgi:hypothetical protein
LLFPRKTDSLKSFFSEAGFELENIYELKYPDSFLKKFPEMANFPTNLAAYTVMVFRKRPDAVIGPVQK